MPIIRVSNAGENLARFFASAHLSNDVISILVENRRSELNLNYFVTVDSLPMAAARFALDVAEGVATLRSGEPTPTAVLGARMRDVVHLRVIVPSTHQYEVTVTVMGRDANAAQYVGSCRLN